MTGDRVLLIGNADALERRDREMLPRSENETVRLEWDVETAQRVRDLLEGCDVPVIRAARADLNLNIRRAGCERGDRSLPPAVADVALGTDDDEPDDGRDPDGVRVDGTPDHLREREFHAWGEGS